jgi:hypothetical protein
MWWLCVLSSCPTCSTCIRVRATDCTRSSLCSVLILPYETFCSGARPDIVVRRNQPLPDPIQRRGQVVSRPLSNIASVTPTEAAPSSVAVVEVKIHTPSSDEGKRSGEVEEKKADLPIQKIWDK